MPKRVPNRMLRMARCLMEKRSNSTIIEMENARKNDKNVM